jgi:L-lactate dehydrogenase complex protein LldG
MSDAIDVITKVRAALGRTEPLRDAPTPPAYDDPNTRLVQSDIGLPELFASRAAANKMEVDLVHTDDLRSKLIEYLRANHCRRVALPVSPLLEKLEVPRQLRDAGFDVQRWDQMTLDALYDFDCSVTDVYCAVAETGSLVMRAAAGHGRALSLVPPIHIAVLEPKNFVPDLVDLFDKLSKEGTGSAVSIVTGPSKTSDIEMNLVIGVHGPCKVKLFVLQ